MKTKRTNDIHVANGCEAFEFVDLTDMEKERRIADHNMIYEVMKINKMVVSMNHLIIQWLSCPTYLTGEGERDEE